MINRYSVPRIVLKGETQILDLDLYTDASVQETIISGTLTIFIGNKKIVDAEAITPGAPATYSLSSSLTDDEGYSDRWLERWTLVTSEGTDTYIRRGHLVRTAYHATITDVDLYDAHSELEDFVTNNDLGITSLKKYRLKALHRIERDLLKRGRRSELIFDEWALFDAHLSLSLFYVFNDFKSVLGEGTYLELADEYKVAYDDAMSSVVFSYDGDETGTISSGDKEAAASPIIISAGNPHRSRRGRRY